MTTTVNLRKLLDRKQWEFGTPLPTSSVAGSSLTSSRHHQQHQLFLASATVAHLFNPYEDGFVQIPSPALAGTFGAGTCATCAAVGPTGTAAAGSTTTITTALDIRRDLRGYSVMITSGPGMGDIRTISKNTIGSSSVITVSDAFSAAITSSSTFKLFTPRWYVLNAGTTASGSFKCYDFALNTWTTLVNTNLPATVGTDGRLAATPSWVDADIKSFATGTLTSATTTVLTNSAKSWATNKWANFQVRITGGTGVGQIRYIASNTSTALTVSSAFSPAPDATSTYSIEGNDDYIYYIGNNAVTLYRYNVSGNTWSVITPGAARAAAPGAGLSFHWIHSIEDSVWSDENVGLDGMRLYSFRGGGSAVLDYYDIAANTWVSGVPYAPLTETFTTGSKYIYKDSYIYIQKDATGRWFRYDILKSEMIGWGTMLYPQGTAVVGDTAFDISYIDGATEITFVYMGLNTSTVMLRQMII